LIKKKIKGQELNKLKSFIEVSVNDQKILIENAEIEQKLKNESIDVTLPHTKKPQVKFTLSHKQSLASLRFLET